MAESARPMASAAAAGKHFLGKAQGAAKKGPEVVAAKDGKESRASRTQESTEKQSSHLPSLRNYHYYSQQLTNVWKQRWEQAPETWRKYVSNAPKEFGFTEEEETKTAINNRTYVETPPLTKCGRVGTTLIISAVGAFSKVLLNGFNTLNMYNMHLLYNAIENRQSSQGLLTVSNHQSVLDDPFLLAAILPPRILTSASKMRWGLCSLDICFQNSLVSRALKLGKALPIQRRGGIAQTFLTDAAEKLSDGDWVHIYPEGRVRQEGMGYSKRGVGKLLTMAYEARRGLPMVLPMYHEGAENIMPQSPGTHELKSAVPRRGQQLFVMTGEPVDVSSIFDKLMPACEAAGGTSTDPLPCLRLYEELADFLGITIRLMRAELRKKVRKDHDVDLGDPYEAS